MALIAIALLPPAPAVGAETTTTHLVSRGSDGQVAHDASRAPSLSRDGRFIAFQSKADELGGNRRFVNIFVHDRITGTTQLISKASDGTPADGDSREPSISGRGRYVAFSSVAANLGGNPPSANGPTQVFVHDRTSGTTTLVSKTAAGVAGDGASRSPSISANGGFIAFLSYAPNLGFRSTRGAAVFDRARDQISYFARARGEYLVVHSEPSISGDGRLLALSAQPGQLDYPHSANALVIDLRTRRVRLASRDASGEPIKSFTATISANGRYVAFSGGPSRSRVGIFVRDLETKTTRWASIGPPGYGAVVNVDRPSVSGNGRSLVLHAKAAPEEAPEASSDYAFIRHLDRRTPGFASRVGGSIVSGHSPSISRNGRWVAFVSPTHLLGGDPERMDVFIRGPLPLPLD